MDRINDYIKSKIISKLDFLSDDLKENLIAEAEALSALGVSSDKDYKDAFYISIHARNIAEELCGAKLGNEEMAKISATLMENRGDFPLDSIHGFYSAVANAMNKISIPIKKIAYPSNSPGLHHTSPFNRNKWLQAMKMIYANLQKMDKEEAFNLATKQWEKMEKEHFKNWMSFYEENAHKKYKTAQKKYMEIGDGAFLPLDQNDLKARIPMPDMGAYEPEEAPVDKVKKSEQDEAILVQNEIATLIGRLNSAERIATKTEAVRTVLGPEGFKTWLNALHAIKREIQAAPINHKRSATAQDLIIKRANILIHEGHSISGKLMMALSKLAQVPPPPLEDPTAPTEDPAAPTEDPAVSTEDPAVSMEGPATPSEDPMLTPDVEQEGLGESSEAEEAMKEFLAGLSGKSLDKFDTFDVDDELFVTDVDLIATAQEMPERKIPERRAPTIETAPSTQEIGDVTNSVESTELENALGTITVDDVISKLESLSKIYGNRELARQLNLVDLMLGRLGLASYFPNLAEAMRSALDSNQYVLTRIEDIVAKLKSSVVPMEEAKHLVNLEAPQPSTPEVTNIKSKLHEDTELEKSRKEQRKSKENSKLDVQAPADETVPAPPPPPAISGELTAPAKPGEELAGPVKVKFE